MKKNIQYRIWAIAGIILSGAFAKYCGGMGEYPTTFQFWCLFASLGLGLVGFIGFLATFE